MAGRGRDDTHCRPHDWRHYNINNPGVDNLSGNLHDLAWPGVKERLKVYLNEYLYVDILTGQGMIN
jgi:hypothetical protein